MQKCSLTTISSISGNKKGFAGVISSGEHVQIPALNHEQVLGFCKLYDHKSRIKKFIGSHHVTEQ